MVPESSDSRHATTCNCHMWMAPPIRSRKLSKGVRTQSGEIELDVLIFATGKTRHIGTNVSMRRCKSRALPATNFEPRHLPCPALAFSDSERIGTSTAYGEVRDGFWARNHCGFPESELAQLPNCRIAGRESTFAQPHTQPNPQRVRIPASTSRQLTR